MTRSRITCDVARSERPHSHAAPLSFERQHDVSALVHRAASGEERAWALLLGRFDATVRAVARRHGLGAADRDEVAQRTWLALLRHIGRLKGHPALGGWLASTARRECLQVLAARRREHPVEQPLTGREPETPSAEDEVLAAERREALHGALDNVPEQRLMRLLLHEPALTYDQLSATLGVPRGSLGPTRARCIARLRGDRHLASVVHGTGRSTARRPDRGHDLA
jgi:RNA polymerase sigma factor (sigma-70 family)